MGNGFGIHPLIEVNHLFLKNQNILLENKSSNFIFNIHPAATRNMIFSKMGITFETTINNETNIINLPYTYLEKIFCKEDGYGIKFSKNLLLNPLIMELFIMKNI